MNAQGVDEDALDSEALQAQIDLSMSFAQGLVSSWMDPHKFQSNSRKDLEKELTDYMRRPPRLGVGASVPEGHQSTSRDIARLKGKLAGSKRAREEEEVTAAKQASDEEGESRAGAIKKKSRPDPFDVVHVKKKKKQKLGQPVPPPLLVVPTIATQPKGSPANKVEDTLSRPTELPKLNDSNTTPAISVKGKKKKKKAAQIVKDTLQDAIVVQHSGSPVAEKAASREAPPTPKCTSGKAITGGKPLDASLVSTPRSSNAACKLLPPMLTNIPLLNLSGPPSDPESDADPAVGPTNPKKKRKRRKKKKSHVTPDAAEVDTSPKQSTVGTP